MAFLAISRGIDELFKSMGIIWRCCSVTHIKRTNVVAWVSIYVCCFWSVFLCGLPEGGKLTKYKVVKTNRESCQAPSGSKYCLMYSKGIVRAVPGTFGIMVFPTLRLAEDFRYYTDKILKVRPIGNRRKPKYLSICHPDITTQFNEFYAAYKKNYRRKFWMNLIPTIWTPDGTECYPAVEVLE